MKKAKLMVAVNYFDEYHGEDNDDNHETMEIFETIQEAYMFASSVKYKSAFVADFIREYIYKENGEWNYKDCSVLYGFDIKINFPDLLKFN